MAAEMTYTARAELTNAVRRRYGAETGAESRKILDEFIAVAGYHEMLGERKEREWSGNITDEALGNKIT